jgi:hypothetical protein
LPYAWQKSAPSSRRAHPYLFGAVCPARSIGAGLVLPEANTEAMNLRLAEIKRHVTTGSHVVVVLE